jgi:cell division protein FtsB
MAAAVSDAGNIPSRQRRKTRRGRLGWFVGVLFVMASLVVALGLYLDQERQMDRIRQQVEEADARYAAALERNQSAHETLDGIGTDDYIERIARDKLGMVKPGERIIDTVD